MTWGVKTPTECPATLPPTSALPLTWLLRPEGMVATAFAAFADDPMYFGAMAKNVRRRELGHNFAHH